MRKTPNIDLGLYMHTSIYACPLVHTCVHIGDERRHMRAKGSKRKIVSSGGREKKAEGYLKEKEEI